MLCVQTRSPLTLVCSCWAQSLPWHGPLSQDTEGEGTTNNECYEKVSLPSMLEMSHNLLGQNCRVNPVTIRYYSSLPYCSLFSWSPTEDGICRESLFTDENKFRVWVWHGWCRDHLGKSCAVRQCHHGHVQGGGWIKVVQRVSIMAPENFWLLCFVTLMFLK